MGARGSTTIDFGSYPGKAHASQAITGQTGVTGTSVAEVWFGTTATAQHNADEHKVAPQDIELTYSDIVAGTGFTARAYVRRGRAYGLYTVNWVWD